MARIIEEDPATKAAREAEEAAALAAKKKADEEEAAAAAATAATEAEAKKKADEEEAATALEALKVKQAAGEELSDEEKAELAAATTQQNDGGEGGIKVTIGEEPEDGEPNDAPEWVRNLRKEHRETKKRLRELEDENKRLKTPAPSSTTLGQKPTLEGCGYDDTKFEAELTAWYDRKRKVDEEDAQKKSKEEEEQLAWQKKLNGYKTDKSKLDAPDFDDAEAVVQGLLNVTQQGIIIQGSDNPRLVMYALGKNPKKAEELAAIKDPLQFAFAVAKMETQMKISTSKKAPPPPDKPLTGGTGNLSGTVDGQLEKLREEAARTGDYSNVVKYKKQKRDAAK